MKKSCTTGEVILNGVGILVMTGVSVMGGLYAYLYITKLKISRDIATILMLTATILVLTLIYFILFRVCRFFGVDIQIKKLQKNNAKLMEGAYENQLEIGGLTKSSVIGVAINEMNLLATSLYNNAKLEKEWTDEYIKVVSVNIEKIRNLSELLLELNQSDEGMGKIIEIEKTGNELARITKELSKLNEIKSLRLDVEKEEYSLTKKVKEQVGKFESRLEDTKISLVTDYSNKVSIYGKERILEILVEEIICEFINAAPEGSIGVAVKKNKPNALLKFTTTAKATELPENWDVLKLAVKELKGSYKLMQEEFETYLEITIPLK